MSNQSNLRGITCMVLATATFVTNDCLMKLALADLPPYEVVIGRGLAAILLCLPMIFAMGLGPKIRLGLNRWVLLRALSEGLALLCFILLLTRVPIGDLTAIMQTTPLLVVAGAALIFGERIGPWRIALILTGFAGALLVAQPASPAGTIAAPLGFLTATLAAGRDILARKVPREVPGMVTAFVTVVVVMTLGLCVSLLFETRVWPSSFDVLCLLGAGLFMVAGQFFVFQAFRLGAVGAVAPFSYLAAVFAVLYGAFFFREIPNAWSLAGMSLIVGSGLAILLAGEWERRRVAITAPV